MLKTEFKVNDTIQNKNTGVVGTIINVNEYNVSRNLPEKIILDVYCKEKGVYYRSRARNWNINTNCISKPKQRMKVGDICGT